jgi:hypothetical protein
LRNELAHRADVRSRVLAAITRIVNAEAAAGAPQPPDITPLDQAGRVRELPTNHNPGFAPVLHPPLETGDATMVIAPHAWMAA